MEAKRKEEEKRGSRIQHESKLAAALGIGVASSPLPPNASVHLWCWFPSATRRCLRARERDAVPGRRLTGTDGTAYEWALGGLLVLPARPPAPHACLPAFYRVFISHQIPR